MPAASKAPAADGDGEMAGSPVLANTKNIVEGNLFDPDRGAHRTGEVASSGVQKVRNLVLLGTAVIGNSRQAIFMQPSDSAAKAPTAGQMRLKLGDSFEGFRVSEIEDRRVVFAQGGSQVEVSLDFLRKFEEPRERVKAPASAPPRIPPRIPMPRRAPGVEGSTKALAE